MNFSVDSVDAIKYPMFESTTINYQASTNPQFNHLVVNPLPSKSADKSTDKLSVTLDKDSFGDNFGDFYDSNCHAVDTIAKPPPSINTPSQSVTSCGLIQPGISTPACATLQYSAIHDEETEKSNGTSYSVKYSSVECVDCGLLDDIAEPAHPNNATAHPTSVENQISTTTSPVTLHSPHDSLPPTRSTDLIAKLKPDKARFSPVIKARIDPCTNSFQELSPIHTSVCQKERVIQEDRKNGRCPLCNKISCCAYYIREICNT